MKRYIVTVPVLVHERGVFRDETVEPHALAFDVNADSPRHAAKMLQFALALAASAKGDLPDDLAERAANVALDEAAEQTHVLDLMSLWRPRG